MTTESKSNALEVTVTELSGKLKRTVEDTFGHVRVRGEISGFRGPHSSGHCYFSLKDEKARLEAVIWRGQAAKLKHSPEEGLEVVASGKLTTYPGSSKYQIVIDNLEPAGAGALMALLEERRKKLAAEGLFDDNRKQILPFMPRTIAVITSPTGAVIRDILHRINDRFPVHVIVWPVRVQGETSGREVANGVYQLNQLPEDGPIKRPDIIIVARGGGSLEDLWGFNDEALVRAAAGSDIPVISAVGHETDWTLVDHAADWRAPTPTAAAEKAVPVKADLEAYLADLGARLRGAMSRSNERRSANLRAAIRGLKSPDMLLALPRRQFDEAAGRLDREFINLVRHSNTRLTQWSSRISPAILDRRIIRAKERLTPQEANLERAGQKFVQERRRSFEIAANQIRIAPLQDRLTRGKNAIEMLGQQLRSRTDQRLASASEQTNGYQRLLDSLSYKGVLARGFAVVRDKNNKPLQKISSVKPGAELFIEMQDGHLSTVANRPVDAAPAKPKSQEKPASTDQGKLF